MLRRWSFNRRDETDEVGLVLASDVAREVIARNRSPERVNVYEIMSKPVLTLPPDMLTRYAVRLLVRFQVSRSIVVDNDRNPIGFRDPARPGDQPPSHRGPAKPSPRVTHSSPWGLAAAALFMIASLPSR